MSDKIDYPEDRKDLDRQIERGPQDDVILCGGVGEDAVHAENVEHEMSFWQALKVYPKAMSWSMVMSFCIVFESYGYGLIGAFTALPAFQKQFGEFVSESEGYVIPTRWQTALTQAGSLGAFMGIFIASYLTPKIGYRWVTIVGLIAFTGFNFISFFAKSLTDILLGQLFGGIPWGFFIANSPAYASEVVPLALRGAATAFVMMGWVLGGFISSPLLYKLEGRDDQWAYRIPFAVQWVFPIPLAILLFFAPESPWWLVGKGRLEEAKRSIERLGVQATSSSSEVLSMIVRTTEIERAATAGARWLDMFKGIDRRRTFIVCFIYAAQNWAGNLIANQSTFFFEQAGVSTKMSFALGIIGSSCGVLGVSLSWLLVAYFGRRALYLWGTAINASFCLILGIVASAAHGPSASWAQAVLGILISFMMNLILGPISYTIIAETSSVRLRPLTTGFGRAIYYVANVPTIFLSSQMLNPTGWHMAGKCGYVWCGTAMLCFIVAYFELPECRYRSYRELDILFNRHTPARKFQSTTIEVLDDE